MKNERHNLRSSSLYKVWAGIKDRTNIKNKNCKNNYKKLSIVMCDEWKNSFKSFYDWATVNGYEDCKLENGKNKLTIDRIDNNKGYCPDNCRWVTNKQQMNNTSKNKKIFYNGETKNLSEWVEKLNLSYSTVQQRLIMGWSIERAFTEDTDKQNYYNYNGKNININQICEITGLTKTNVWNRIHRGWDINRIMTQKPRKVRK